MMMLKGLLIPIVIASIAFGWRWYSHSTLSEPLSPPHSYRFLRNFVSDIHTSRLRELFEDLKKFPAAKADQTNFVYTDIGEAEDPNANGGCDKTYLVYNPTYKKCIFPSRVDIGRNFILTGGYDGWKEKLETIISRSVIFINYQFDNNREEFKELFEMKEFKHAVNEVCQWYNKPYFRPFQVSNLLLTPGQAIPAHLDVPYFDDASRYIFPQWLLLVMQESGLFRDSRIPQVQAIVYIHEHNNLTQRLGGELITHPQGPYHPGIPLSTDSGVGIFCDGSEMVHGSATFQPQIPPLEIDKDATAVLDFDASKQKWVVLINGKSIGREYSWGEVRASVVYRGWCFKNEEEAQNYDPKKFTKKLTLDMVIDQLTENLIKKGRVSREKIQELRQPNTKDRNYAYELGLLLMDEYIKLPVSPQAYIPYNYCLGFKLLPQWEIFKNLENLIC